MARGEGTPARRLMEEARVLRQMIAARQSPQLQQRQHATTSSGGGGSSARKKKALAQRAPLQRLSSNSVSTPRQQQDTALGAALGAPAASISPRVRPLTLRRKGGSAEAELFCSAPPVPLPSTLCDRIILAFVLKLQAWARAVLARRRFDRQRAASLVIQRYARGYLGRELAELILQADLNTFLTPFKTRGHAKTPFKSAGRVELPAHRIEEECSNSCRDEQSEEATPEEEEAWNQWLRNAKAAEEAAVARPRAAPVVSAKAVAYLNQRRVPAPAFTTAGAEANADAYEAATWQGEIESEDV